MDPSSYQQALSVIERVMNQLRRDTVHYGIGVVNRRRELKRVHDLHVSESVVQ